MGNFARGRFGPFSIDVRERVLLRDGNPVLLAPKAFDVLIALVEHAGRLLTKEELLQRVWPDTAVEEANLSYNVFAVRRALGDTVEGGQYIETVPKHGYRFTAVVTPVSAPDEVLRPALGAIGNPAGALAGVGEATIAAPAFADNRAETRRPRLRRFAVAAWFALGVCCAWAVLIGLRPAEAPPPTAIRAQVAAGVFLSEASPFALSPDGRHLAFTGSGSDGVVRLWVRSMDAVTARPLAGSEAQLGGLTPPMFWSPDSRSIAFDAAGSLKRVASAGGAPQTVCSLPDLAVGGSWNEQDVMLVGNPAGGLMRCSATGGPASQVTQLDSTTEESAHLFPSFLPDGKHFLYLRVSRQRPETSGVYLGSLDETAAATRPERLIATGYGAAFVRDDVAGAGHILFLRDETLFAQSFDPVRRQLRGDPVPLATPVGSYLDGGFFAASQNDVIVFRSPDKEFQLTWFDRRGNTTGVVGEPGRYSGLAISPDGTRVALVKAAVGGSVDQDLWRFDVAGSTMARVTFQTELEQFPVWSADGARLIFTTGGEVGAMFEQNIGSASAPQLLLATSEHNIPTSASADGRFLLYTSQSVAGSRRDLWVLPLTGARKPRAFVRGQFDQEQGEFSPDGRWVAYVSNESGRHEVIVRPFADAADGASRETIVSRTGGSSPRWSGDGKELYFIAEDGAVTEVDVGADADFRVSRQLFVVPRRHGDWVVDKAGSRFLVAVPSGPGVSTPFNVLWNGLAAVHP
jgi:eukaryotic-like serine/threonine-protein kinase